MRFLHTADWQLGMRRHFLTEAAGARFADDRLEAVRTLCARAAQRGCDFIVACGDLYEAPTIDRSIIARSLEAMNASEVPLYLLPGNHDPLNSGSIYRRPDFLRSLPSHVTVLSTPGLHPVGPGVDIVAAPWLTKSPAANPLHEACNEIQPAPDRIRIGAGHGQCDVWAAGARGPAILTLKELERVREQSGMEYLGLGDRHSTSPVGSSGRIWYSGAPEPTAFDEQDPGNVLIVDIAAPGSIPQVSCERIGRWTFTSLPFAINTGLDIEKLSDELARVPEKSRTALTLLLTGTVTVPQWDQLDSILSHYRNLYAALIESTHNDLVIYSDERASDWGLAGFFATAAQELAERASSGEKPARRALKLLFRLSRERT